MHRRCNFAYFLLAGVVLCLTPLMVDAGPPAQIAFSSNRDGNYEIYVMDADGKNQRKLTNGSFDNWAPSWSPDGEPIVFASNREGFGSSEIFVMNADGKNRQRLTGNRQNDLFPSWSPDGERIAFVSRREGNSEIYVINTESRRDQRRLTHNNHDDIDPVWFDPTFAVEVAPFAVAPAGKKLTLWGSLKQVD